MKWHERHAHTIELALMVLVGLAMLALFLLLLIVPVRSHAAACLTIDVPPQAVLAVVDGDTFSVFNLMPPGYVKVRVTAINTPEHGEPMYAEATEFTRAWLAKGPFSLSTCGKHTFERITGTVARDGRTLADDLLAAGLGKR